MADKVNWFVETDILEESFNELKKQCELQGHGFKCASGLESMWNQQPYTHLFKPDDCVVYRGSLEFGAQVKRETPWVPGVYCDMDKYDCTYYYPRFKKEFLFNRHYIMVPYGDLMQREEELYELMGNLDCIFIRPNRGNKIFTGKMIERRFFAKDVEFLGFYNVEPEELCVVCEPRNVQSEWRFIVVDNKIITGSKYRDVNNNIIEEPVECGDLEMEVASAFLARGEYQPERVWVLDMCRAAGLYTPKVLEVNSFSCSGLYGCNIEKIVREVSRVAKEEWDEYRLSPED